MARDMLMTISRPGKTAKVVERLMRDASANLNLNRSSKVIQKKIFFE
jgi:hypothetical protein